MVFNLFRGAFACLAGFRLAKPLVAASCSSIRRRLVGVTMAAAVWVAARLREYWNPFKNCKKSPSSGILLRQRRRRNICAASSHRAMRSSQAAHTSQSGKVCQSGDAPYERTHVTWFERTYNAFDVRQMWRILTFSFANWLQAQRPEIPTIQSYHISLAHTLEPFWRSLSAQKVKKDLGPMLRHVVAIMVYHIISTVLHFTGGYRMLCLPSACSNQSYTRSRFCALSSGGCSLDSGLVFGPSLSINTWHLWFVGWKINHMPKFV